MYPTPARGCVKSHFTPQSREVAKNKNIDYEDFASLHLCGFHYNNPF